MTEKLFPGWMGRLLCDSSSCGPNSRLGEDQVHGRLWLCSHNAAAASHSLTFLQDAHFPGLRILVAPLSRI